MSEQAKNTSAGHRRLSKTWRVVLVVLLVVVILLGGLLYSQRHEIHLFIKNLTEPPAQTIQVTPLTLPAGSVATMPVPLAAADWPTYHANNVRSGFVADMPDPTALTGLWHQQLDGAVYAEPLIVGGRVIVVTENDTFYVLDAQTGQTRWRTHVGQPVPLSALPCGDIDSLGITSTPVYDPQTGLVFAVAEVQGPGHVLFGVDVNTGQVKVRRLVDPPGIDPRAYQQRSALTLDNDRIYIAYGGLAGDCSDYRGLVVAMNTDGTGPLLTYQLPTTREGGIWTPPGPSVDAQGNLYVSVGNGAATQGNWDHTDSVLRLSPTLQLEDGFAPRTWPQENASDQDLGSLGPVLLSGGLIFIQGKSSRGYLVQAKHLGGVGGQLQTFSACADSAFGGAAVDGSVAFIPCTDGLREISLSSTATLTAGWQAPQRINGSPVIGGHTVYSLDVGAGVLYALNTTTGRERAAISVGAVSRFATPTLFQKIIFVGTMTGLVAVEIRI